MRHLLISLVFLASFTSCKLRSSESDAKADRASPGYKGLGVLSITCPKEGSVVPYMMFVDPYEEGELVYWVDPQLMKGAGALIQTNAEDSSDRITLKYASADSSGQKAPTVVVIQKSDIDGVSQAKITESGTTKNLTCRVLSQAN